MTARWRQPPVIVGIAGLIIALAAWLAPVSPKDASTGAAPSGGTTSPISSTSPPGQPVNTSPTATEPTASETTSAVAPRQTRQTSAAGSGAVARTAKSPLYLDVDGSYSQYKAGPNQYRADHDIKFSVHVSDDVGEVSSGCYAKITAIKDGAVIKKDDSGCYPSYGWINLHQGSYTLQFDITTDWGATGRKSVDVQMVA